MTVSFLEYNFNNQRFQLFYKITLVKNLSDSQLSVQWSSPFLIKLKTAGWHLDLNRTITGVLCEPNKAFFAKYIGRAGALDKDM